MFQNFQNQRLFDRAVAHYQAGRLKEALPVFLEVAGRDVPVDLAIESLFWAGECLRRLGMTNESRACYEQAV